MPGGNPFNGADRYLLDETIRKAEHQARVEFSVFVGNSEGEPREFAQQLHASLVAPGRSILIMVDPTERALEIVTGGYVRRTPTDAQVALAAIAMQSAFAHRDLVDGLVRGINQLAQQARAPQTLHAGPDGT